MRKRRKKKASKKWRTKVDNKMRSFGITDYSKKEIRVNKKKSKRTAKLSKKAARKKHGMSRKETSIINTIVHEDLHRRHPRMHEKTVMRKARIAVQRMGKKAKRRLYTQIA